MMNNMNIIRKAFQYAFSLRPDKQANATPHSHTDIIKSMRENDVEDCEVLLKKHIQIGKQRMIEQALGFKMNNMYIYTKQNVL